MIISYLGEDKYKIKTHDASIILTLDGVEIEGFKIQDSGEYERKNIFVEVPFEQRVFKILIEDVTVLYLDKSNKISDSQIEQLDSIDILFLPCGEQGSMNLKDALELSAKLEPSIIIPMFFQSAEALKKEGLEGSVIKNAKITKASLPQEGNEVLILEQNS